MKVEVKYIHCTPLLFLLLFKRFWNIHSVFFTITTFDMSIFICKDMRVMPFHKFW